jgi:hypothetical protein
MRNLLQATLLAVLTFGAATSTNAQEYRAWSNDYTNLNIGPNNVIKLNLPGLAVSNSVNILWERFAERKVSHTFGLRTMIPGRWPAAKIMETQTRSIIGDTLYNKSPFNVIFGAKFGGLALSYELRRYFGKRVGKGIYWGVATHADWTRLNTNVIGTYNDKSGYNIPVKGNYFSFGAGSTLGWHIPIGQQWSIDIGSLGFFNYNIFNFAATSYNFGFTSNQLKEINEDLSVFNSGFLPTAASVTNTRIDAKAAFPYGSYRYTLAVGYRFMDKKVYR